MPWGIHPWPSPRGPLAAQGWILGVMLLGPGGVGTPGVSRGLGHLMELVLGPGGSVGGRMLHDGHCFPTLEWITWGDWDLPRPGWPWVTHACVLVGGQGAHGASGMAHPALGAGPASAQPAPR